MSTTPISMPQSSPDQYADYVRQVAASQANTTGLTQMSPNLGGATPPTQRQFKDSGQQQNQRFGPGEGAARKRESMQNLVKASQSFANKIGEQIQAKQNREYEQTITRFTGATQGIAQAQAQVMQATQALKQNPQDQQAQQQLQQAKSALQQNQLILNDLSTDKKHAKTIMKAFGIDDKNANSPERQAAIAAMRKQSEPTQQQQVGGFSTTQGSAPGQTMTVSGPPAMNQQSANIQSQIPQTQQLSPQAQQQQQARQAGVVGAPATQGQVLAAQAGMAKTEATEAGKNARAGAKDQLTAALNGQKYNDQGQLTPMTQEEISKNPVLSAKIGLQQSRQQLAQEQAHLAQMRATALPEQIKLQEARISALQGNLMMRQKEFGIKVAEEERRQLETAAKIGDAGTIKGEGGLSVDVSPITHGRPLQSWAQQTVVQTQDRLQQVSNLMQKLEPLKDNNQAGYLAMDRLGYAVGIGGENGELASEISNIELQRVVNASTILKGSSRAWTALHAAMIHTPDAWVDSPKLMYQKLQTIQSNLQDMQRDAVLYGQKNQRSSEFPAGGSPPKTSPDKPASSGGNLKYDPSTGTVH